jgi:hypothetical protein
MAISGRLRRRLSRQAFEMLAPRLAERSRSLRRHGRQNFAVVKRSPSATSYHHFCWYGVQTSSLPQDLQTNGTGW